MLYDAFILKINFKCFFRALFSSFFIWNPIDFGLEKDEKSVQFLHFYSIFTMKVINDPEMCFFPRNLEKWIFRHLSWLVC